MFNVVFIKLISLLSVFFIVISCEITPVESSRSESQNNVILERIDALDYYKFYSGHEVKHLEKIHIGLKKNGCKNFVYFAGDSSLDNKHWIFQNKDKSKRETYLNDTITAPALNGYELLLNPPRMVKDVDYWMNKAFSEATYLSKHCSIMTSVEASTLEQRKNKLLVQDNFIKENITNEDYLIVSVGGNDLAFGTTDKTKKALAKIITHPDDSDAFNDLLLIFKDGVKNYVEKLIENNKPKKVIVCMIYFLDEANTPTWANILKDFSYSTDPKPLQNLLTKLYQEGTKQIVFDNVNYLPVPLFEVLDGKTSSDYFQRVEPSVSGGEKMAKFFIEKLFAH